MLTGCLFCGPLFATFCFLNTVAIVYNATAALPFGTIVVIVLIWTLVTSPLLVLGGIAGKNSRIEFQAPCRTTKYPREIPQLPWYRSTVPQMAMAGFLPFSAIYIELYYIFASVWGHKIYTIYSILFIVFIILLIVTAFITVALTYFQLTAEDHEWWWRYTNFLTWTPPLISLMLFLALIHWFTFSSHSHIHLSRQYIIWPHSFVKYYSICFFLSHFHLFHFLPFSYHRLEDHNDSPYLPLT